MRITIFGASGKVGRRVVELAVQQGHNVVAVVHKHDPFTGIPNLVVKTADIYNPAEVVDAMQGSDAVICTLGSWGTPKRDVVTSGMRAIIPAMEQQGIKRLITLTGYGANAPDQPATASHDLIMKLLAPFPAGKVFYDGEEHMQLLVQSSLDWTTLRSSVMNSRGSQGYELKAKPGFPFATIHRQAVAQAILDQLDDREHLRQAPVLIRK